MRGTHQFGLLIVAAMALLAGEASQPSCRALPKRELRFPMGGVPSFIMRGLPGPEGAVDFRIIGRPGEPAILSLIGPNDHRYADLTYNGANADVDVGNGSLNLRPVDGKSSVNVWSMSGNARLRIGAEKFRQSVDLWHTGTDANIRTTAGDVVLESPLNAKAGVRLSADTVVEGTLRVAVRTPASSAVSCRAGETQVDEDFVYVCFGAHQN